MRPYVLHKMIKISRNIEMSVAVYSSKYLSLQKNTATVHKANLSKLESYYWVIIIRSAKALTTLCPRIDKKLNYNVMRDMKGFQTFINFLEVGCTKWSKHGTGHICAQPKNGKVKCIKSSKCQNVGKSEEQVGGQLLLLAIKLEMLREWWVQF